MHDQERYHGRKGGNLLLRLGHTDGNTHCKYDGQIVKYNASSLTHDYQQGVQNGPISQNPAQSIGGNGCGVGK